MAEAYEIAGLIDELYKGEEQAKREGDKQKIEGKKWRGDIRSQFMSRRAHIQKEAEKRAKAALRKLKKKKKRWGVLSTALGFVPLPGMRAINAVLNAGVGAMQSKEYAKELKSQLKDLGGVGAGLYRGTFLEDHAKGIDVSMKEQVDAIDPDKIFKETLESGLISGAVSVGVGKAFDKIGDKIGEAVKTKDLAKFNTMLKENPELADKMKGMDNVIGKLDADDLTKLKITDGKFDISELSDKGKELWGGSMKEMADKGIEITTDDIGMYATQQRLTDGGAAHLAEGLEKGTSGTQLHEDKMYAGKDNQLYQDELKKLNTERQIAAQDKKLFGTKYKDQSYYKDFSGKDVTMGEAYKDAGGFFGFKGGAERVAEGGKMWKGGVPAMLGKKMLHTMREPFTKQGFKEILTQGYDAPSMGFYKPFIDDYEDAGYDTGLPGPHDWFAAQTGWREDTPK